MGYLAYRFGRVGAVCLLMLCLFASLAQAKTYSDNGDGTVTDPTTGLTWMRCAMGQEWDGATCSGTAKTYTYEEAKALTGTVSFAGHGDWRLPNIRELLTILDRAVDDPAIDKTAFPDAPSLIFWSSSYNANVLGFAWHEAFTNCYFGNQDYRYYNFGVRLVRGGKSVGLLNDARPSSDYVDHRNGTVTHIPTGLIWKRCAEGKIWTGSACSGSANMYTWEAANRLRSSFTGRTDWRLPTIDELLSLVDYAEINDTFSLAAINNTFWSNSPSTCHSNSAWGVNLNDGHSVSRDRDNGNGVRLVRGGRSFNFFALSITKTGSGKIGSALASIDCGDKCTGNYTKGAKIILQANPAGAVTWGGACTGTAPTCIIVMDAKRQVSAHFKKGEPTVVLSATHRSFSPQKLASSSVAQSVVLRNDGNAALKLYSIVASGDYAVSHNCGAVLNAGASCSLSATFEPTQVGARSGYVVIVSDAARGPHAVALDGVAVAGVNGARMKRP